MTGTCVRPRFCAARQRACPAMMTLFGRTKIGLVQLNVWMLFSISAICSLLWVLEFLEYGMSWSIGAILICRWHPREFVTTPSGTALLVRWLGILSTDARCASSTLSTDCARPIAALTLLPTQRIRSFANDPVGATIGATGF